jgi:hypothetical protein
MSFPVLGRFLLVLLIKLGIVLVAALLYIRLKWMTIILHIQCLTINSDESRVDIQLESRRT